MLKPDPWLGTLVGRPSFNVTPFDDARALRGALPPSPAFVTAKIPVGDIVSSIQLQELGFRVVDTALSFACDRIEPGESRVLARLARPEDRAAVEEIARSSFRYTRFHLDPGIPDATADAIKAAWAGNFFSGQRGDAMIVAELDGAVVGFLLALVKDGCLTIDLIAVEESAARRGAGSAMIRFAAHPQHGTAPSRFRVATQAANVPSCRMYEQVGFRFHGASFVLHHHGVVQ